MYVSVGLVGILILLYFLANVVNDNISSCLLFSYGSI